MAGIRRVAITGGTGLIGRALSQYLAERGVVEQRILTRNPQRRLALPPGARLVPWRAAPDALAEVLQGVDAVVHMAGANVAQRRWTEAYKAEIYRSRVETGRALAQALAAMPEAQRPRVFVQMSAVGYYGDRGDAILTEDQPPGQDFLARLCVDWEAATQSVQDLGMRWLATRTGIVLSREGGALPRMALPIRWFVGGPLADGQFYMPWIHIVDQVRAMAFLMNHPEARGPFNLTAPEPVTNEAFTRALARVLRRPARFRVPRWALRLALGEMADAMLASLRAVPKRLLDLGFTFRFPDLASALQDLFARG